MDDIIPGMALKPHRMVGLAPVGKKDFLGADPLDALLAAELYGPGLDILKFQILVPVQGPVAGSNILRFVGALYNPHGKIPFRHGNLPVTNIH